MSLSVQSAIPAEIERQEPSIQPQTTNNKQQKEEALPLPRWLVRVYYIFPIVLYVPDMIFNFFVYSDGSGLDLNNFNILQLPIFLLWGFVSAGIVGMAWLLSILAPWHWVRGNRFQSVMCWVGVFIATAITTWNSLAFRSIKFKPFAIDQWIIDTFHVNIAGFSPTMIIVAVAPPFWGLFWAIVQPAERRRSAEEERESYAIKIERLKQETELKRVRAESNAMIRKTQLLGLVDTVRSARDQGNANEESTDTAQNAGIVDAETTGSPVAHLPVGQPRRLSERRSGMSAEELTESGEHEIVRGTSPSLSYSHSSQIRPDVYQSPNADVAQLEENRSISGEFETLLSTSRTGIPRASTLLRNYADGEHVMRAVDADIERMRTRGMKVTIKSFAEFRGVELTLSKQLLNRWKEWKQSQQVTAQVPVSVDSGELVAIDTSKIGEESRLTKVAD